MNRIGRSTLDRIMASEPSERPFRMKNRPLTPPGTAGSWARIGAARARGGVPSARGRS